MQIKKNRYVQMVFEDSGVGISKANVGKVFDPFFTTKRPSRSVGLGLSISYSIIVAHGGTIEVESVEGRGTAFKMRLPAA